MASTEKRVECLQRSLVLQRAETPAQDIEGLGIKLALYVYMSGVDFETADSAVEQILSAYRDCVRVLGRDLLREVKSLMPASQQRI